MDAHTIWALRNFQEEYTDEKVRNKTAGKYNL